MTSEESPGSSGLPHSDKPPNSDELTDANMLTDAGAHPAADSGARSATRVGTEAQDDFGARPNSESPDAGPKPETDEPQQADTGPGKPQAAAGEPLAGEPPPAAEPGPTRATSVREVAELLGTLTAIGGRLDDVAASAAELARLRARDTDLIARLHEDVTRLRTGEIAAALNPVVIGMIKLHDQMVSLGALSDPASPVGMLYTQLLQVMELTCAVRPFTPAAGERFDASRHIGTRRIPTTDASADGTIASTNKAGFARADGSVVRVAEVEVHRLPG